ncbi:MAG: DNA-methyltransferase [Candidatus Hodarchaeota archaeon]
MKTSHRILFQSAQNMDKIDDESIELVVTSPPYPMIEMWDEIFAKQNPSISKALQDEDGSLAFQLMNDELNKVWNEVNRVLVPGGIACINIGDATRTIGKKFQLYPSHALITKYCNDIGFVSLPEILWRKQTNAPNKFMGSGMMPPGAYVTLEHEFILIFRKGNKREFPSESLKETRRESSYFWEERNTWFSDVWDFKGITQRLDDQKTRNRSGAFPFELAYRLINMFSITGDMILDPFLGTGTSMLAAMVSCRNSVGIEIDPNLRELINDGLKDVVEFGNGYIKERLKSHDDFINQRTKEKGATKYVNANYDFPVVTNQETLLKLPILEKCNKIKDNTFEIIYKTKNS